jgi:hypothetical protein
MAGSHFLRLSLVSCPILLYPATSDAHDGETGVVVDTDEIVKGYNPDRVAPIPAVSRPAQESTVKTSSVHFFQHLRRGARETRQDHVEVVEKHHSILDAGSSRR